MRSLLPHPLIAALLVGASAFAQTPPPAAGGRMHVLKVTVVDADTRQPVAAAAITCVEAKDIAPATTGADGMATLNIPVDVPYAAQIMQCSLTVKAPGYAVRRVMWNATAGRVRETLPAECEMKLFRGGTIGGVVRDEQGRAVAGARIEFYGSGYKGVRLGGDTKSKQEYSEFNAYGDTAPVTDGDGVWQTDGFPPDLDKLTLTVIRPGGARAFFLAGSADSLPWQQGQRIDLAVLKSGRAEMPLKAGFTVKGRVVDEAGRPLAGVTLRARDAASSSQAYEFTTDPEGRFELQHWAAAKVLVSAEHDGYLGTTVTILTATDAAEAKIVLRPGPPLRLRVVDEKGNPISGAEVMTDPNPSEQIVSWKAQTDAAGRAVWPAAPGTAVKYWINAKEHGFRSARLPTDGTEHVIRFRPGTDRSINVRLRVVDAASGAPIPSFEVWRRMPGGASAFNPWGEAGATGDFLRELTVGEFAKGFVQGYRLQVRAAGYGTWGSETLDFTNGDQEITVKLAKGGSELPDAPPPSRQAGTGQDGDSNPALLALAVQVARLLETGDIAAFTRAACATQADWQAIVPAGVDPGSAPHQRDSGRALERYKKAVTASAEHVLALARQVGVEPGAMRLDVKSVNTSSGRTIFRLGGQEVGVPRATNINIVLTGEPAGGPGGRAHLRGDYQLVVGVAQQLPAGWKCEEGVRWRALPAGVGDNTVKAELRVVNRVSDQALGEMRSLSGADDAALSAFGETVVGLLRTGDVPAFVAAIKPSGADLPPEAMRQREAELSASAHAMLAVTGGAGIDFSKAEVTVKQVIASAVAAREFGAAEPLRANALQVALAVEGGLTPAGRSIAGRYKVSFGDSLRMNGRWLLGNPAMRWEEIPEGLLADDTKEAVALESYVAVHRALPPGRPAPEIEIVRLADNTPVKLSAWRGKVVILEFWATWCGPCQEPMAKLQEMVRSHPEWKDRAEVITVSIDSKAAKATAHLAAKGWNQTSNFWAGAGEFKAPPPVAYRVQGIPTSYVIDRDGKIIAGGHPESLDFPALVEQALK